MNFVVFLLLAGVATSPAAGTGATARLGASMRKNPIRKLITLMQDMQKSVEEEGEKDEELYDKFMCYCKTTGATLDEGIEKMQADIEDAASEAEAQAATKAQLDQEIAGHKADRAEAEKQTEETVALRKKDAELFAATSGEAASNIASLTSALEALKKSGAAALLQNSGFDDSLREAVLRNSAVAPDDKQALLSLLSTGDGAETEGSSDQIIGIVSQMLDETKQQLAELTASEAERKSSCESLLDSKSKEIKAATLAIEEKSDRAAQCSVKAVEAKAALGSYQKSLADDQGLKVTLTKGCTQKEQENEEVSKTRTEEISALSEAMKVLNDGSFLQDFKQAAPSASFLQTFSRSTLRFRLRARSGSRARDHSRVVRKRARAISSKGFEKVVKMVDGMIGILKEGEATDKAKKDECLLQTEHTEASKKELDAVVNGIKGSIEEKQNEIDTISGDIDAVKAGIVSLDKSVAEATAQRKEEHVAYIASTAANNAAIDLLHMAANKLNKFYDPKNHVAPTEEPDLLQTDDGQGGVFGGIFFAQVRARSRSRSRGAAGIFALLAQIEKEVALKMSEEKHDAEAAQKAYEESTAEAAEKRAVDSKGILTHEVAISDMKAQLEDLQAAKSEKDMHLKLVNEKLADIHGVCDKFLAAFEERQKARAAEIEGDASGKQILSGME